MNMYKIIWCTKSNPSTVESFVQAESKEQALFEFAIEVNVNPDNHDIVMVAVELSNSNIPDICYEIAYWNNNEKYQRRIVCAANRYTVKETGEHLVIPSVRHYSKEHHHILDPLLDYIKDEHVHSENQGFVDQYSNYWTREEALVIATHAGQVNTVRPKSKPLDVLFSEDLY